MGGGGWGLLFCFILLSLFLLFVVVVVLFCYCFFPFPLNPFRAMLWFGFPSYSDQRQFWVKHITILLLTSP